MLFCAKRDAIAYKEIWTTWTYCETFDFALTLMNDNDKEDVEIKRLGLEYFEQLSVAMLQRIAKKL